jgi:hypothetical protein
VKVTLESTTRIVELERAGQRMPARIWDGTTDSGIKVYAAITRIAVHKDDDATQFDRELEACAPPSPLAIEAMPLRMIL